MPFFYANHWCLLVLDTVDGTVLALDPLKLGDSDVLKHARFWFNKYIAKCQSKYNNALCKMAWQVIPCSDKSRPLQRDGVNCGIYIMYYMDCITRNKNYLLSFNPDESRIFVAELLLQSSAPMAEICLYCFNETDCFIYKVQCLSPPSAQEEMNPTM